MSSEPQVPPHVPADLAKPFDLFNSEGMQSCPHQTIAGLRNGPRIFWSTSGNPMKRIPGFWVITRQDDMRELLQDTETFSSRGSAGFSALIGESWPLIPTEIDPPEHAAYRNVLNPLFSPVAVKALEEKIRLHAASLLEGFRDRGRCEFITDFAQPFPILIFLSLMGLPGERIREFVGWVTQLLHGTSIPERAGGARQIADYLRSEIAIRQKAPRDDAISAIINADIGGRRMNDDELIGMIFLAFAGGLDTVVASLGYHFYHMAREQEFQSSLRRKPELIPKAVDELFRVYGIVSPNRTVAADTVFKGVQMKAGDKIMVPLPLGNFDSDAYDDPTTVKLDRSNTRHMTFSSGPHFCVGMHLARREIAIAYEQFFQHIPQFRCAEESVPQHGGTLFGIDRLELEWDA